MDRREAIQLLRGGTTSVQEWNNWRVHHSDIPNLSHADFRGADLTNANLSDVHLEKTNFAKATLIAARFENSNLKGANFRQADLNHAKLVDANLLDATSEKAALFGADFRRAILKRADFESADCDTDTKWPNGFDPKAVGIRPWLNDQKHRT
jgi:uncharacterized protein YjbI with pentapeptide repeats